MTPTPPTGPTPEPTELNLNPGTRLRHRKGGEYIVIAVARHTESGDAMVVYHSADDAAEIWVRPLMMFADGRFEVTEAPNE